eukprot:Nk52_evm6s1178 gene=Nk52_evmTU6s1178
MKFSASYLVLFSVTVAVSTFMIIIFMSLSFDFEAVNATVCKGRRPYNFFPSISASVGKHAQRSRVSNDGFLFMLSRLCMTVHTIECLSLALLAFVSSSDNYPVHKLGFISFMLFQTIHMYLHLYLFRIVAGDTPTIREAKSIKKKQLCLHTVHCEDYVYSMFGLCEWSTVFANIGYHFVGYYDFRRISIGIDVNNSSRANSESGVDYIPITQA